MSVFARLGHRLPAGRRAYSFFSSNGRYHKPAGIVAADPNSSDGRKPPGPSAKAPASTAQQPKQDAVAAPDAPDVNAAAEPSGLPLAAATPAGWHAFAPAFAPVHPAPTAQDMRLHQFFSLHRPLLNLAQPGTSVFDAAPASFAPPTWAAPAPEPPVPASDYLPDTTAEADADAARQLARAIVMNRVGATVSFDAALRHLGLDLSEGRARAEEVDLSDLVMHLDSTKRKRRKKMKKHKYVFFRARLGLSLTVRAGSRSGERLSVRNG
jgi:hypothetical protein